MFSKLKQYKDLRDQAKNIQGALLAHTAVGEAAWGKIKVTMNGSLEIIAVAIDPELLAPAQKERLEAGLKDAVNDVTKKMQKIMAETVQKMGGLDIPGMGAK